jgi:ribonuclease HI
MLNLGTLLVNSGVTDLSRNTRLLTREPLSFSSYSPEITGMTLALQYLLTLPVSCGSHVFHLYTDSQSLVEGIPNLLTSAWDSYRLKSFRSLILKASQSHRLYIHWIRGHTGILRNEMADQLCATFPHYLPDDQYLADISVFKRLSKDHQRQRLQ